MRDPMYAARPNPFAKLVGALKDHERVLAELEAVRSLAAGAREYSRQPGGNAALGRAHLEFLEAKRARLLGRLRAGRAEAHRILGIGRPHEGAGSSPRRFRTISHRPLNRQVAQLF